MAASTQPARGMRDFLPDDVRRREYVIRHIKSVYERYGFAPLETPAVENIETLLGKYGEEGNQLIFKILKRGEQATSGQADLALRYDLTVPLARVVAEYRGKLPKFFKRYQIQPVWRADRPARGRFREFYQCDVDAIGTRSMLVEAELCAAACDALTALGFDVFTIRLNHRRVLAGILDGAGVPGAFHADALVALDKLDKIGRHGVQNELVGRGLDGAAAEALLGFVQGLEAAGGADANLVLLDRVAAFVGANGAALEGVAELRDIVELSSATSAATRLRIDPSLARGLSYYTGAIMEIASPDLSGSLGGGGRYDNLVGMFSGDQVPAAGFSLGLERLIVVMTERGMFPAALTSSAPTALVTRWNPASGGASLALARELRAAGVRADVYPEADKLGKQFKYASALGVRFVLVEGDDERARGEVTIKDLTTGTQSSLARGLAASHVRDAAERS